MDNNKYSRDTIYHVNKEITNFLVQVEDDWRRRYNILMDGKFPCRYTIKHHQYVNNNEMIMDNINVFVECYRRALIRANVSDKIIGNAPVNNSEEFFNYFIENAENCLELMRNRNNDEWKSRDKSYVDYLTINALNSFNDYCFNRYYM